MKHPKPLGAALVLLASFGLVLAGQPGLEARLARLEPELAATLASRSVHLDPAELVDLMHNNQVRLLILDVRDEADFNLFHLLDAERVGPRDLRGQWPKTIDPLSIVVVVSNGETRAEEAWKLLQVQGVRNAYLLAGGINLWLELYGPLAEPRPLPVEAPATPDRPGAGEPLRFTFPAALGDRIDIAWPDPHAMDLPERDYEPKAKVLAPITLAGGGCG